MCLVDPTSQSGVQTLSAERNLTTGDTTIMRNGVKTRISDVTSGVPVASNADWYIRGEPFSIGYDKNKLMFVTVGSARTIDANDLDFIGTVNGMPVFAERQDVTPPLDQLGPNADLNRLVGESKDVHTALDKVKAIYVPLSATGCVFQELDKQVAVRKY